MTLDEIKQLTEEMQRVARGQGHALRIMCDSSCGCDACLIDARFDTMARAALPKLIAVAEAASEVYRKHPIMHEPAPHLAALGKALVALATDP